MAVAELAVAAPCAVLAVWALGPLYAAPLLLPPLLYVSYLLLIPRRSP